RDFEARLGEKKLESLAVETKEVLAAWTEEKAGGLVSKYEERYLLGVRVKFTLPAGRHTLHVRYDLAPKHEGGDITKLWTLRYRSAPAQQWEDFGGLELTVQVPEGWNLQGLPQEAKLDGDTYKVTFRMAPAQDVLLKFQAEPGGHYERLTYVVWGVTGWAV